MPSFRRAVLQRASLLNAFGLCLGLGSILAAPACNVQPVPSSGAATTTNECRDNRDCKGGAGICDTGRCKARQGLFSTLLLEVSPPASGNPAFAGVTYLHRADVNISGGRTDVLLAAPVQVTGAVSFEPYTVANGTCSLAFAADQPGLSVLASPEGIPVSVSFTPSARILGVSSTTYEAKVDISEWESDTPELADPLSFDLKLPPGEYDIYIRPRAPTAGGCEIPPTLIRRTEVPQTKNLLLGLALPQPASFSLSIKWPKDQPSLAGWTVDMLDPRTGLVISTKATLPELEESDLDYGFYETRVSYAPVTLEEAQSELVRLAPPEGVDAPSIILARSGLELFSPGSGVIDRFSGYPEPVTIEGQLTLAGQAKPSAGTVSVVSTSIQGIEEGVFASFTRSAETSEDGKFTMRLLPGTYRVYAWPASPGGTIDQDTAAATQTEWEIAAQPELQAGKTVELLPAVHVTGTANLLQGEPALGSAVIAIASPGDIQVDPLTRAAQGNLSVAPAAESAMVDDSGFFDIRADPGVYDISVRPPDGSGFAWYVASQVLVQPATTPMLQNRDLGPFNLPLPVPYAGQIAVPLDSDNRMPIAEALLRAYIYLDQNNAYTGDPTRAASVVQIGETRADADGNFELLIPANLN